MTPLFPVLAGLLAASGWAVSNLASRRASARIGTASTVALSTAIGVLVCLPLIAAEPLPVFAPRELLLLAGAGSGGVVGLLFAYRAYRVGRVALVAPIISCQGAVAAILAVLTGEALTPLTAAMLGLVATGVVVVALGSREEADGAQRAEGPGADTLHAPLPLVLALAGAAAACFGLGMFSTGQLAGALPLGWAAIPSRLVGSAVLLGPLAIGGRLRISRSAIPAVLLVALSDIGAILVFSLGAREAPAVASVFGSQVAVVSALGAIVVFRERPSRLQLVGLCCVAIGAAVLAVARA